MTALAEVAKNCNNNPPPQKNQMFTGKYINWGTVTWWNTTWRGRGYSTHENIEQKKEEQEVLYYSIFIKFKIRQN